MVLSILLFDNPVEATSNENQAVVSDAMVVFSFLSECRENHSHTMW